MDKCADYQILAEHTKDGIEVYWRPGQHHRLLKITIRTNRLRVPRVQELAGYPQTKTMSVLQECRGRDSEGSWRISRDLPEVWRQRAEERKPR